LDNPNLPLFPGLISRDDLLGEDTFQARQEDLKLKLASMVSDICFGHSQVLVLGAGFSRDATGTDWAGLTQKIGQAILDGGGSLPQNWASLSMPERAQAYLNWVEHADGRCRLEDLVAQHTQVGNGFPRAQELSILQRFSAMSGYILTTNYDTLAEQTLESLGIPFTVVADEHEVSYPRPTPPPGGVLLIKLHGDLASRNMIISQSDYDSFERERPRLAAFARELLGNKLPVFFGFGLSDPNINSLLPTSTETPHVLGYAFGAQLSADQLSFAQRHNLVALNFDSIQAIGDGMRTLSHNLRERAHFRENLALQIRSLQDPAATAGFDAIANAVVARATQLVEAWPQAPIQDITLPTDVSPEAVTLDRLAEFSSDTLRTYWEMGQTLFCTAQNGARVPPQLLLQFGEILFEQGRNDSARQSFQLAIRIWKENGIEPQITPASYSKLMEVYARFNDNRAILRTFDTLAKSSYWDKPEFHFDLERCLNMALYASTATIHAALELGFNRRAELLYVQAIERFVPHIASLRAAPDGQLEGVNIAHYNSVLAMTRLLNDANQLFRNSVIVQPEEAAAAFAELTHLIRVPPTQLTQAQYSKSLAQAVGKLSIVLRGENQPNQP
jgi:hypothetical protein